MTIRFQTLRRDNGLDNASDPQRFRMPNDSNSFNMENHELAEADRDPTREEIEAMCEEIREGWSEKEHWKRRGYPGGRPVFTVPRVRNIIEDEDVVTNQLEVDGLHLSDFLILVGLRKADGELAAVAPEPVASAMPERTTARLR